MLRISGPVRVSREIQLNHTENGTPILTLFVTADNTIRENGKVHIGVTFKENLAVAVHENLQKGDMVYIEGLLSKEILSGEKPITKIFGTRFWKITIGEHRKQEEESATDNDSITFEIGKDSYA